MKEQSWRAEKGEGKGHSAAKAVRISHCFLYSIWKVNADIHERDKGQL